MPSINQILPFLLLGVYALANPVDVHQATHVSSNISPNCYIAGVLIEDPVVIRARLRGDNGGCGVTGDDKVLFDILLTKCINHNPNNDVCSGGINIYPDSILSLGPAVARTPSVLIAHALDRLRGGSPGGGHSGNGSSGGSGEAGGSGVHGGNHSNNGDSSGPGGDRNGGTVRLGLGSSNGGAGGSGGSGGRPSGGGPGGLVCRPTV